MTIQTLTLELDSITAADYLQWVRDPEPRALGGVLRSVSTAADPLGNTIVVTFDWDGPAPPPHAAAANAGLPLADGIRIRPAPRRELSAGLSRGRRPDARGGAGGFERSALPSAMGSSLTPRRDAGCAQR